MVFFFVIKLGSTESSLNHDSGRELLNHDRQHREIWILRYLGCRKFWNYLGKKLFYTITIPGSFFSHFQNIGESEFPSILRELLPIIKTHSSRTDNDYTPEDLLVLLVYIYSIVGEIKPGKELDEAESEVKKALVHSICDEPELPSLLQKITGKCILSEKKVWNIHFLYSSNRRLVQISLKSKNFITH